MRPGWFVAVSIAFALIGGSAALTGETAVKAVQCNPTAQRNAFLAYCTQPKFTDYEHGAYYLRIEREAVAKVENAQVLILGSSLAQFAFSTDASDAYFRSRNLSYYLLGFGYDEGGRFSAEVRSRIQGHAGLYVIHVYNFFGEHLSTAAKAAMTDDALVHFLAKKAGAEVAGWICIYARCGPHGAIYRSRDTGAWLWTGSYNGPDGTRPLPSTPPPSFGPPSPSDLLNAERLVKSLGVPPECIVITTTPNDQSDQSEFTRLIARHIHATAVIPDLDRLVTLDGYHLDRPSAERWSAAFFRELDAISRRCVIRSVEGK